MFVIEVVGMNFVDKDYFISAVLRLSFNLHKIIYIICGFFL